MGLTQSIAMVLGVAATVALAACNTKTDIATSQLGPCSIGDGPRGSLCGELTVYEDREAESGRTIDLKIVVAPALRRYPASDPLFVLIGGPGGGAATMAESLLPGFRRFQADRDIVFVDQRGTGASNPLDCEAPEQSLEALANPSFARLRRCLDGLEADPRFYTTSAAMDDLDDVRVHLGYHEINLYGVSYGTVAALDYLNRHEEAVRSLVLDSAAPRDAMFPLYVPRDAQRVLDRLIDDCEQQPQCASTFPDLADTVDTVMSRAAERPTVRLQHPRTGELVEGPISRGLVAGTILGALYTPSVASLLPRLLADAASGDFQGLVGLNFFDGPPPIGTGEGALLSVHCAEGAARLTHEDVVRAAEGSFLGTTAFDTILGACTFWPTDVVSPSFFEPVESTKPVLVLSGLEDPAAPPVWGEQIVETLGNARHVIVPGTGHVVGTRGCVPALMEEFLSSVDAGAIDTACLGALRRPPFVTDTNRGESP